MNTNSNQNPNKSLPGSLSNSISVPELTKQLNEARDQAKNLADRANKIYRKMHPTDELKTDIYDMTDFLQGGYVKIPPEIQKLFDIAEEEIRKERGVETSEKDASKPNENVAPSAEDLQASLDKSNPGMNTNNNGNNTEDYSIDKVKKNPVLSKLLTAFGLTDLKPKVTTISILGMDWTFEFPTSFITNFAVAWATSEGIGSLDFGYNIQLATVALSLVSINGVPLSSVYEVSNSYKDGQDMPARLRKICAVKTIDFINSLTDEKAKLFFSAYSDNIGFSEDEKLVDNKNFAELECPKCANTKIVAIKDGKFPVRYCELCGERMVLQSSTESDENLPLE